MQKMTYFFDVDGTLIDSMKYGWDNIILKYLKDRNIEYPDNIIAETVTKGFMGIAHFFVDKLGVKEEPQTLYDYFMEALEPMYQNDFPAKQGAMEFVEKLRADGCKLSVISGSPLRFVVPCLKRLGLYDLFDNVFSLEEFGHTKVEPELFLALADKVNVKPENCTVIDDSINAIKTAKRAGFKTIGMYDIVGMKDWDEMQSVADKTAYSFLDLM